jgi:hypothetical protein
MRYRILIEGRNFLVSIDQVPKKAGFYTTRYIEADNPTVAENIATELIMSELDGVMLNEPSDRPVVHVEKLEELRSSGDSLSQGAGFTWFLEESS